MRAMPKVLRSGMGAENKEGGKASLKEVRSWNVNRLFDNRSTRSTGVTNRARDLGMRLVCRDAKLLNRN